MAIPRSPYIAGKALSGVRGFVGRDDVFQLVETVLQHSDSNAIVLFGQRRIGKTSILLNLQSRLPSPPFVTVFFDLQDRARKPLGEVSFELAQTIAQDLDLPSPDRTHFDDSGAGFRDSFLPTAYEALGEERRLVLLFDEFDVLDARLEEQLPETSAARAFIPAMRRLINEEPQLAFVFVVGRKADELSIEFMSAFKTARFHRITVLDPESVRRLVLTAQREGTLTFDERVPDRILALAAGHPFFTQLLCQLLFERAYRTLDALSETGEEGAVPMVTLADVEAVVPDTWDAGEHIYEWIWDGLPPAERVIFSAMAAGTDEHTVITRERLLDVLQAQGIRILIRELELAPKTLIEWQMLKEADGGYQFFVELMRRWVAERKPLPRVKEELDRVNPLADTLYQGASGFYRSGDLDGAVNQLQTALRVNPNHLKARLLLGEIYKIQGKPDEAVRELAEAYRIDPDGARLAYENALLVQAEAHEKESALDEAIATYSAVLEISPANRVAQERKQQSVVAARQHAINTSAAKAEEYERAEQWDDAIVAYQHLVTLSDDQHWQDALERAEREHSMARRYGEGLVHLSQRQWVEAQRAFADVVAERPRYKDAAALLALAAANESEDFSYDLTTPRGRRTFRLAWLATCMVGWLLGLAVTTIAWWRLRTPILAEPVVILVAVGVPLFVNLVLQVTLLRRFMSLAGRGGWISGNVIGAALAGAAVLLVRSWTSHNDTFVFFAVAALFAVLSSAGISWLQERLSLRPELGQAPGWAWTLPTMAGRLLGIAAGAFLVVFLAGQNTLTALANLINASQFTALFLGATVWALISGSIGAVVLTRRLARSSDQPAGEATEKPLIYRDRRMQTWLPGGLAVVSLVAATAVVVRVISLPVLTYPSGSMAGGKNSSAVAFSPDGQRYFTEDESSYQIRYTGAGQELLSLQWDGHSSAVNSAAYNSYGTRIVTASDDNTARVWDAQTGQQLLELSGHTSAVSSSAYSPDGTRIVTASGDDTARVWDAQTGQQLLELSGHFYWVRSAAYSPDGSTIVTASDDDTARVWDAQTGQQLLELSGHTSGVNSAAYSPDGTRIVTASDDNTTRVWDAQTGQQLTEFSGHTSAVISAVYSPDGAKIATASDDNTARIWDTQTGQQLLELSGHTSAVNFVLYSPDGTRILTASADGTVRAWDAETGQQLSSNTGYVNSAAFSPDGARILTTSDDNTARVWDTQTIQQLLVLNGQRPSVNAAAYGPGGTKIAITSEDDVTRVWDAQTGQQILQLSGYTSGVSSGAYSPDGARIVTASDDNIARVWDAHTGQPLLELSGHNSAVHSAAYSPDGTRIVTASDDNTARVWDAQTGQQLTELRGHTALVKSAGFSPDGTRVVTASDDDTVRVWDAQTGQQLLELSGHLSAVNSAAYSPDGTRIVTASDDETVRMWDADEGQLQRVLVGFERGVDNAVFSPDNQHVFAGSNSKVVVFDLSSAPAEPVQAPAQSGTP